jgi:endonuclease YncB( thermonuclease family)
MPLSLSQHQAPMEDPSRHRWGRGLNVVTSGMRACLVGALLLCCLGGAFAADDKARGQAQAKAEVWSGWVSWVMDGDTVLLVREGQREPVKLRIEGIDAPETCQPGGREAREALMVLALRKPVQVTDRGQDSYGRQIGRLSADGVDLGAEMVRSGQAWAYSFRTGKGPYAALQRQAEKQKKGVFATQEAAMSPALFRKFHGNCHGN